MHYIIIEDLESDREYLSGLIQENCSSFGEDVHLSCYPDGEAFLADFRPGFCSAVFIDIILGDGKLNGIQTAEKLRETDRRLPIIFTTTETGYALAGYKVHPLDYLTKPVSAEDLSWCLQELREYLAKPAWFEVQASTGQGTTLTRRHVFLDDFLYAETTGSHRLAIHTVSEVILTRLSLSELSALLPGGGRFHVTGQGSLVNLSQVSRIQADGEILFLDGRSFFCSRRRIKETQAAFSRYLASAPRSVPAAKRFAAKHGIKSAVPGRGESFGESFGASQGESAGSGQGESAGSSQSESAGSGQGESTGPSQGESAGSSRGESAGSSQSKGSGSQRRKGDAR